jgi:hypothetical protein
MRPGDYVGEMSLIDNEPHSATEWLKSTPLIFWGVWNSLLSCPKTVPWPRRHEAWFALA